MEKNVKVGMLLDLYGEMLTDKQKDILDLYYNDNLSLAEISEDVGITRQAVRDSIVKGENKLFRIRRKTRNYEKGSKTRQIRLGFSLIDLISLCYTKIYSFLKGCNF